MNHVREEDLVLHYYGEAEDPAAVERHLNECGACRDQLDGIRRMLAAVPEVQVPERGAEYAAKVWQQLRPHLASRPKRTWSFFIRPQVWAFPAAALLLVTLGFLVGRTTKPQGELNRAPIARNGRDRILLAAVGEHLQRSEILIAEYVHSEHRPEAEERARAWAESLVNANRLYRQAALAHHEEALANVLDELEPVLIEIEHSSSGQAEDSLVQRIQSKGVLFKIQVTESQIEQRSMAANKQSWSL
jgi:hypothetical protein